MLGRFLLTCFTFFIFYCSVPSYGNEPLLFIVNHPGSPPYLYFDKKQQKYLGVIPDVLSGLTTKGQLNFRFVSNSRKRSEEQLYQGQVDMIMLSTAWLKKPGQVIATVPLHQHKSYLYQTEKFSPDFSLNTLDGSRSLCTRKGFVYPTLASYIEQKRLIRVDSSNHLSMMRMLFKQRCQLMVMNEFNALNIINSAFFTDEALYRSPLPISTVPLNIILRPELTEVKQRLDKHILALQEQGELTKIIRKHTQYSYE